MAYPKGKPKSRSSKRKAAISVRLAYAEGRRTVRAPAPIVICKIEKCGDVALAKALCRKHYQRQYAHGDPQITMRHSRLDFIDGHRWCSRCQAHLPSDRFGAYPTCYCKQCTRERVQIRKYGVSVAPDSKCAICGGTHRLAIDHCHDHEKVRGVLCGGCNAGIAMLKHDPKILAKAIRYLKQFTFTSV